MLVFPQDIFFWASIPNSKLCSGWCKRAGVIMKSSILSHSPTFFQGEKIFLL